MSATDSTPSLSALSLKLSNDRKTAPICKWAKAAKRWEPIVPNAFGLPAGKQYSCPGETPFCEGCYAARTERVFTSAGRLVMHNYECLAGRDASEMAELLGAAVTAYLTILERAERRLARLIDRVFRIHWDGDFYSLEYAIAWARVIRRNPDVQFWLYTRSFAFVGAFEGLANVAVYLSVDEGNVHLAQETKLAHPWVRLAFCGQTWDDTEVLASKFDGERKGPRCPELTRKLPLVNDDGVGACVACGLCIYGRNNVRFAKER